MPDRIYIKKILSVRIFNHNLMIFVSYVVAKDWCVASRPQFKDGSQLQLLKSVRSDAMIADLSLSIVMPRS